MAIYEVTLIKKGTFGRDEVTYEVKEEVYYRILNEIIRESTENF